MEFNKLLLIIRGVSGCGKTTLGNILVGEANNIAADTYFYELGDGEYAFDATKLGEAHAWCKRKVEELLKAGTPRVAVSNTSTRERDVNTYRYLGLDYGYTVAIMTVENWHEGVDAHNVPEETLVKMEQQLKNSIKLR
ncbi:MAG: AAA family ATPase [Candidatus Heimdallarchaeaceae archaeon]